MPSPLPPAVDMTPRLIRALSDADRLVGQLAGEGRGLPNLHLLMRPFVAQEAVLSSRFLSVGWEGRRGARVATVQHS